jgi:5-methylcytosine-specific restriction enzyme subunit McrC
MRIGKIPIVLSEYDNKIVGDMTEEEYDILRKSFNTCLETTYIGEGKYNVKAKEYVGNIVLPQHVILINPKFKWLNLGYMLSEVYEIDPDPFGKEDLLYEEEKQEIIFEQLTRNLLKRIELLCRRGISKTYYEKEENLPYVRGRIMLRENIVYNRILKQRIFCRYSDFGPDNPENRIIKHTLYQLSKRKFQDIKLQMKIRLLLHYFESVSSVLSLKLEDLSRVTFVDNRHSRQYEPIINLCKLILSNSSLDLQRTGEVRFSSFLIDMNVLFEQFLFRILKARLDTKEIRIMLHPPHLHSDEQEHTEMEPDIVIKKGKNYLLVIDAKYKDKIYPEDLNQVWVYTIALSLRAGVLIYPEHLVRYDELRTLRISKVSTRIKTINLDKITYEEFKNECSRLAGDIWNVIRN